MALRKRFFSSLAILMCAVAVMPVFTTAAFAKDSNTNITGKVYEFEKDAHYEISSASAILYLSVVYYIFTITLIQTEKKLK